MEGFFLFEQIVQNKLQWAITGHAVAQIIA